MTDIIRRHPIFAAVFGFLLLVLLLSSVSVVPETRQGVGTGNNPYWVRKATPLISTKRHLRARCRAITPQAVRPIC